MAQIVGSIYQYIQQSPVIYSPTEIVSRRHVTYEIIQSQLLFMNILYATYRSYMNDVPINLQLYS